LGTDVDDSLALLYLVGSIRQEEQRLLGVTTCYGPTDLRAKLVRMILDGAGFRETPVTAGAGVPCGTHRPIWTTGTEGLEVLSTEEIRGLRTGNLNDRAQFVDQERHLDAARFIVDKVRSNPPGAVQVLWIFLCVCIWVPHDHLFRLPVLALLQM
jgi:inosine-uridine nucleoside N-ribohydrolase